MSEYENNRLIMLEQIREIIAEALFEANNEELRISYENKITDLMESYKDDDVLDDFLVVCDDTNNTQEIIDKNDFVVDLYLKFNGNRHFTTWNFVLSQTDVNLNEVHVSSESSTIN